MSDRSMRGKGGLPTAGTDHVLPYLGRSLQDVNIDLHELQDRAQEWFEAHKENVPRSVQQLLTEVPSVQYRHEGVIDKARGLLGRGKYEEAKDALEAAPRALRTAAGAEILAHIYYELGEFRKSETEALRSTEAAVQDNELTHAVETALWAADHLDETESALIALDHDNLPPFDRLRLLAAVAAANRRNGGTGDVNPQLLTLWEEGFHRSDRSDSALVGRLAGLVGRTQVEAIREALETIGLRDLHYDDRRQLAFGLQVWDETLSGSPDVEGPIAQLFDLPPIDSYGTDTQRVSLWMDVLFARGSSHGTDVAGFLMKAMYGVDNVNPILRALADIYAARDDRSLLKSGRVKKEESRVDIPDRLASWQSQAMAALIAGSFTTSELKQLLSERLPNLAVDISRQDDRTTATAAILRAAEAEGQLKELLEVIGTVKGSEGLGDLLRESLTENPWEDGISPQRIRTYLEAGAVDSARELFGALMENLKTSKRSLPRAVSRRLYGALREFKLHEEFETLSRFISRQEPDRLNAALAYALALIDRGKMTAAIQELLPWRDRKEAEGEERVTIDGLIGLAYERLYLDARPNSLEPRDYDSGHACDYYREGFIRSKKGALHLGVYLVSLLAHRKKTREDDPEAIDPEAASLARTILDSLPESDSFEIWERRLELCLVRGERQMAIDAAQRMLEAQNLTKPLLQRALDRLQTVHQLRAESDPGTQILPVIRVRMAQFTGGELAIQVPDLALGPSPESESALERVLAVDSFRPPMAWFQEALRAARTIVQVGSRDQRVMGTGVFIDARWVGAASDRPLILTCAHLVSDTAGSRGEIRSEDCIVTITDSGASSRPNQMTRLQVRQVFTSPGEELDVTLLEVVNPLQKWEAPQRAAVPESPFPVLTGQPVIVVGYSEGNDPMTSTGNVIEVGRRHLWYTNPGAQGSSGSPIFDSNWSLVGLHHARNQARQAREGIRIDRILDAIHNEFS